MPTPRTLSSAVDLCLLTVRAFSSLETGPSAQAGQGSTWEARLGAQERHSHLRLGFPRLGHGECPSDAHLLTFSVKRRSVRNSDTGGRHTFLQPHQCSPGV